MVVKPVSFRKRGRQSDCTDADHVRYEMPTGTFHMVLAIRHPAMGEEGGEADLSRVTSCASLKMHKNHVISMFTSEDSVTCFPLRGEQGPYVLAADISPNRVFLLATV